MKEEVLNLTYSAGYCTRSALGWLVNNLNEITLLMIVMALVALGVSIVSLFRKAGNKKKTLYGNFGFSIFFYVLSGPSLFKGVPEGSVATVVAIMISSLIMATVLIERSIDPDEC